MIKSIIHDRQLLKHRSVEVAPGEDITQLVQDLKDTLEPLKGYGLAAPQIGVFKQVAILRMIGEILVLVNPIIEELSDKIIFRGEACFSFPGLFIDTDRWSSIVVNNNGQRWACEGIEAIACQHEIDHLQGILYFDRKHKRRR